ncbi:ATP-binding protein [Staphylococcus aureus]|uniref:AAA family ATPase n=3 Tax=Staphylococcus aureus TaxID=1280 RepID=UPI0018EAC40B|nr:AAA family ATPase [Staphylococcus aureus]MBJ6275304.1 ATP-binding protein [Staphylococcus aureus]MBJ6280375.1 ATP-binding protein [Staphylococcus aureus]MBJ6283100.1 ATP-binding protein [Staphylococcus aureus]MBJ6285701.1 ATP-binding protein [Staphylococcus aureus]
MKALKIIVNGLSNFKDQKLDIDFITSKKVNSPELNTNVARLFNNIYNQNTLSFIGINASGKTTTLELIETLLSIYIDNKSISFNSNLTKNFNNLLKVTVYLYDEISNNIYMINSTIKKDDVESCLYFDDEDLYTRKVNKKISRKNIFDIDCYKHEQNRKKLANFYLKSEDSIFSSILNQRTNKRSKIFELINLTDINFFAYYLKSMSNESFIRYLDPSIEIFKIKDETEYEGLPKFEIKFKNSEIIHTSEIGDLGKILSSGTIKGLNIFANIFKVLVEGGYLIIDEIENHLNKRIVSSILEFFLSDININGATLIFSTHYIEILDDVDRSDSIYILNKDEHIKVKKLSERLGKFDRADRKKSEVFLSGIVDTVPDYNSYMRIKEDISKRLKELSDEHQF